MGNKADTTLELIQQMEMELHSYLEMIEWTGGVLALTKCFFSIMEWEFNTNGTPKLKDEKYTL